MEKEPKTGPFGLRDALYFSLAALAMAVSWREWLWWRFAVEELRLEQRMLLSEVRRVQSSLADLEKKVEVSRQTEAAPPKLSAAKAATKAPRKPRAQKTNSSSAANEPL